MAKHGIQGPDDLVKGSRATAIAELCEHYPHIEPLQKLHNPSYISKMTAIFGLNKGKDKTKDLAHYKIGMRYYLLRRGYDYIYILTSFFPLTLNLTLTLTVDRKRNGRT